jgi:uncharacterized protein YcbK (DUF882 family)
MAKPPESQPKQAPSRDDQRNQKLSEHFTRGEMQCPCCEVCKINPKLLRALEDLRVLAGNRPITVNSAYRCEKHNAEVGGAQNSQHLYGNAADIVIKGLPPVEVAKLAREIGRFKGGGIGLYRTFVHVDVGPGPRRWKG